MLVAILSVLISKARVCLIGQALTFRLFFIAGLLTVDPARRLTLVEILAHDWLCGRVDVPSTPLMTPDVLDMSGSHVGTALRVALNVYHKAARSGFTLMDVANAPLAKRRKKKNYSNESRKGSDEGDGSSQTISTGFVSDSSTDTESLRDRETPDILHKQVTLKPSAVDCDNIPALAVCYSPSNSRQTIIKTNSVSREPPPLRPISADSDYLMQGPLLTNSGSNFFFKDVRHIPSLQVRRNPASSEGSISAQLHADSKSDFSTRSSSLKSHSSGVKSNHHHQFKFESNSLPAHASLPSSHSSRACVQNPATSSHTFTCNSAQDTAGQSVDSRSISSIKPELDALNNNNNNNDVSNLWNDNGYSNKKNTRKRPHDTSL